MKNLLYLFLILILASCKVNEPKEPFKIDLTKKVYIKAGLITEKNQAPYARIAPNPEHLSPLEVVKQAKMYRYQRADNPKGSFTSSGWAEKDTVSDIPAFIQYGASLLGLDGFGNPIVYEDFLTASDLVIVDNELDTIGYIPNENFINAELKIRQTLADKDTASVYDLFQNAFKFYPITGHEWLELKKQNLN